MGEFGGSAEKLALSRVKYAAKLKSWRENTTIKTDWLEEDHWLALAYVRHMRLPDKYQPCDVTAIRHWLHKLGLKQPDFEAWAGYTPAEWMEHNPSFSLRATIGLLLEDLDPDTGVLYGV